MLDIGAASRKPKAEKRVPRSLSMNDNTMALAAEAAALYGVSVSRIFETLADKYLPGIITEMEQESD